MPRLLVTTLAILMLAVPLPVLGQAPPSPDLPALLSADEVSLNEDLGIIIAAGNVEISQVDRLLLADTVTYNQRTDIVTASGNVSLLEPDGNVLFADYVQLTGDLRNGIARNLGLLMTDESRFAAAGGQLRNGIETQLNNAVYSPCKLCEEDPTRAPIWQIKALKVIHNSETHDVVYRDAWVEMWGVPVAYTPYLSHPDPTVERRSGFLTPTFGSDSQLGLVTRLPYFFVLDDDKDATLEPIVTSKERVAIAGQYRQRLMDGEFEASGSVTRVARRGDDAEVLDEDITRGHFFTKGRFDINRTWRWGFDGQYTTDDTYLRRYSFDSTDTLTTSPFIEGFRGRNYASAKGYYFRGLREQDDPGETPIVAPLLDYNHVGRPDRIGGRWTIDTNLLALTRTDGTDSRRVSLKLGWAAPYTSSYGDVWTLSLNLQNDAYWVNEVEKSNSPTGDTLNGLTGRIFPQATLEWRYPFIREGGHARQLVEPVVALVVAPNGSNPSKIPNEDSTDFEFDDTNLFSPNRFPGLDRVNGGQRIVYGLKGGVYGDSAGYSEVFMGQSYRFREDDTFDKGSGLREQLSDYVGRLRIVPADYLDLLYRFRLERTNLGAVRNEVKTTFGTPVLRISSNYLFFEQVEQSSDFSEREELTLTATSQLTEFWSIRGSHRRDLTDDGGPLSHSVGLTYEDECFAFHADFTRSFTRDRDFEESDSLFFRLVFKHLGEVKGTGG